MLKVAVFLDYDYINTAAQVKGCHIDYCNLLRYLADAKEGRQLLFGAAYVPLDPRQEHARDSIVNELWVAGFIVKTKTGRLTNDSYECSFSVEMTMDATRVACELKPDIIVFVAKNGELSPLILELRNRGIRVEIAAFAFPITSTPAFGCISLDECMCPKNTVNDNVNNSTTANQQEN